MSSPFHGVPHPVTYIVGPDGVILSRHFEEDFRQRQTASSILIERYNLRTGAAQTRVATPHLTLTTSASNSKIRPGERVRLLLDFELKRGMHVYAPGTQGYIPIDWSMPETPAFRDLGAKYPRSETLHLKAIKESVPVYRNRFSLQREVVIAGAKELNPLLSPAKTLIIRGVLRYQACDDKKCYLPENVPVEWTLSYEPHDSTRVPAALQRK